LDPFFSSNSKNLERFDHLRWISTFRKLYKNLHVRDKTREVGTRFSETTKELAELLGITPVKSFLFDFQINNPL